MCSHSKWNKPTVSDHFLAVYIYSLIQWSKFNDITTWCNMIWHWETIYNAFDSEPCALWKQMYIQACEMSFGPVVYWHEMGGVPRQLLVVERSRFVLSPQDGHKFITWTVIMIIAIARVVYKVARSHSELQIYDHHYRLYFTAQRLSSSTLQLFLLFTISNQHGSSINSHSSHFTTRSAGKYIRDFFGHISLA